MRSRAVGAMVLACASAFARATSAQNEAEATRLFAEGQSLMSAQKYEDACAKFEGSLKAGAGTGTMLYLGSCYEKTARPSSAYSMYRGAEALAHARNDARESTAHELAEAIAPRVSWLTLKFVAARPSGYELRRDGSLLDERELDAPIPVDPGPHLIEARAPDRMPWKATFRVDDGASTTKLDVPDLKVAPRPGPVVITRTSGRAQRIVGGVLAGIGVVGLGVGSALGVVVLNDQAATTMPGNPAYCDDAAHTCLDGGRLRSDALGLSHVVDVTMAVGVAAVIGGAIVYFTAPKNVDAKVAAGIPLAPTANGIAWSF